MRTARAEPAETVDRVGRAGVRGSLGIYAPFLPGPGGRCPLILVKLVQCCQGSPSCKDTGCPWREDQHSGAKLSSPDKLPVEGSADGFGGGGWEDLKGQRRALKMIPGDSWDTCAGMASPRLSGGVCECGHPPAVMAEGCLWSREVRKTSVARKFETSHVGGATCRMTPISRSALKKTEKLLADCFHHL